MSLRILGACCLLGSLLAVGCSPTSDIQRFDVKGSVNYAGQPVPKGTVTFYPMPGTPGPGGFADIVDGKFNTSLTGKGTTGGPHRVTIHGYDGNADLSQELPLGKPLFVPYEIEVDLPQAEFQLDCDVPNSKMPKPSISRPGQNV